MLLSGIGHIIIGAILLLHIFNIINAKTFLIGGAVFSILYGLINIHRYVRSKTSVASHKKEE